MELRISRVQSEVPGRRSGSWTHLLLEWPLAFEVQSHNERVPHFSMMLDLLYYTSY